MYVMSFYYDSLTFLIYVLCHTIFSGIKQSKKLQECHRTGRHVRHEAFDSSVTGQVGMSGMTPLTGVSQDR